MRGLDYSKPLSLYIHVPFCHSKCDYCAFYSLPEKCTGNIEISRYISTLSAQIKAINEDYQRPFYSIFIGGGNPGILGYENIMDILKLAEANGKPEEVTIEINPEDVNAEISSLAPYLTRVSVGVQSLNEKTLRTLGRNASLKNTERALSILSSSPFDFNVDLMVAVPGQRIEDVLDDIEGVNKYNPGHISLYCLTFEEGTPLIERAIPVGEDVESDILLAAWHKLSSLGFEHYEISNFAKKGKRCKHNMVYWKLGQYIGLGPSAESSIGYSEIVSMRNTENLSDYLKDPAFECTPLDTSESKEEYLLVALRINDGIDKDEYRARFGSDFDSEYEHALDSISQEDYINTDRTFSLTESGMMKLDRIILTLALQL